MRHTIFGAYTLLALAGAGLTAWNGERHHAAFILVTWTCLAWGLQREAVRA